MSIKSLGVAILLFVGSIMLAYMIQIQIYGNPFDRSQQVSQRNPGSVGSAHLRSLKEETLKPTKHGIIHSKKLRGPVTLNIEPSIEEPAQPGEVFRLRLVVISESEVDTLDYQWNIPEGMDVIYGSIDGQLYNLTPNEPQFVEIDVRSYTTENRQIHASISGQLGPITFGEVAQFNTIFEPYLKQTKSDQLDASSTDAEESNSHLKIYE